MKKWCFTLHSNFFDCDEPFFSEIERKRQIIGRDPNNQCAALAWDGDKVDFACANGGEGPVLQ